MSEEESEGLSTHSIEVSGETIDANVDRVGNPMDPNEFESLGRYKIKGALGSGTFGQVLLAHDQELGRDVAIKLPNIKKRSGVVMMRRIAEEARMVARLQHPGIVTVYDVGTHNGLPFIVMEYIRGRPLSHLLRHETLTSVGAAQLAVEVAQALAHAHERGFIHRDIKPSNILLDQEDRAHVGDFGLALRYRDVSESAKTIAGTTLYMAPEQARGENHRIDERTDIWSLGVTLYRMLTGRLPFDGRNSDEIFDRILHSAPVPPSNIEPTIHPELERICLRCLHRQMSERYRLAIDLSDDLIEWLGQAEESGSGSGSGALLRSRKRKAITEVPHVPIVPRGLRSFGQEDGDFFLKLVPGPRDRDGLPTSLAFWKRRINERDPHETFAIGLMYGPSGCGKSSLVKAGLLPRVQQDIVSIYVDTTLRDSETRLLRSLRRSFPELDRSLTLSASLRQLREGGEEGDKSKVLIILDQFEQWLQCWSARGDSELVRALLQCDGGNVQCIISIRDDFWLPISRFMHQLEAPIVDGENSLLVDSFDLSHARLVLQEFGIAYGRLPEFATDQTEQHTAFIDQAIDGLAEDGRLYPVRLAVFVEMVKDHEWAPNTLRRMGGTEGVGVAFLEYSFGTLAHPARRLHERSARNVLTALLPPAGQINGPTRSYGQLLAASGYEQTPEKFDELLHLLDVDLRLLTPTELTEFDTSADTEDDDTSAASNEQEQSKRDEKVYHLTHDFLVPSVQSWIERNLRSTPAGRAHLMLKEQAELWKSRPLAKHLPSLQEWLTVWWRTSSEQWTDQQRQMMRAAGQRFFRLALVLGVSLVCLLIIGRLVSRRLELRQREQYAEVLCSNLQDVEIADVPPVIQEMSAYRTWTDPLLRQLFEDETEGTRRRVRAALALLPSNDQYAVWLSDKLVDEQIAPTDVLVIRGQLQSHEDRIAPRLEAMLSDHTLSSRKRFRVAATLAGMNSSPELWRRIGVDVAAALVRMPAAETTAWITALKPVSDLLVEPLTTIAESASQSEHVRIAVGALTEYRNGGFHDLVALLPGSTDPCYRACVERLRTNPSRSLDLILERLRVSNSASLTPKQQAHLIEAAFELGGLAPLREASDFDPQSPALRAALIHALHPGRMSFDQLVPLILDKNVDDSTLAVILMGAWRHIDAGPIDRVVREPIIKRLLELYRSHPGAEIHAASGLLLRGLGEDLTASDSELGSLGYRKGNQWFVDKVGNTMIVLDSDKLTKPIAISSRETNLREFRTLFPDRAIEPAVQQDFEDVAVAPVSCVEIAFFCNLMSELNHIPHDEWCYPPASQLSTEECCPLEGYTEKTGYRIPTNQEWEVACRAGTTTRWFFGQDPALLDSYCWNRANARRRVHRVAQLLPNPLGLFDVYGNVAEITVDAQNRRRFVTRGASSRDSADQIDSAGETEYDHRVLLSYKGFRLVRTIEQD